MRVLLDPRGHLVRRSGPFAQFNGSHHDHRPQQRPSLECGNGLGNRHQSWFGKTDFIPSLSTVDAKGDERP